MTNDLIASLDRLSRSSTFRNGEILEATEQIMKESAKALSCERVNTWMLNEARTKLSSYRAYDSRTDKYSDEGVLAEKELPNYFKLLLREDIIVSNVARDEPINRELVDIYIDPLQITAMIDIPIRSEGVMIGLICFEHVAKNHVWSDEEIKFTLSISNLLSLAYETYRRRRYQLKLERIIHEKVVLISEVNHRVKNNITVILSLINLQRYKCADEFHENLFKDLSNRIYSMSEIQQQLHLSQNYSDIDLRKYLLNLIANLNESYGAGKSIEMNLDICQMEVDITKAIPCGLIVNEVVSNSYKYAFGDDNKHPILNLSAIREDDVVTIRLKDNGPGLPEKGTQGSGMGRELIEELTEQLGGKIEIYSNHGAGYNLTFKLKEFAN